MKTNAAEHFPTETPERLKRKSHDRDVASKSVGKDLYKALTKVTPKTYEPRPIGRGAEHLVFEFNDPRHSDVVYKVNYRKTLPVLQAHINAANARFNGEIDKRKAIEEMEEQMFRQKEKLKEMRTYFGNSAIPVGRFMIRDVPISRKIIDQLYKNHLPKHATIPKKIPAWVMIQRRVEIDPHSAVPLFGEVLEDPQYREGFSSKTGMPYEPTHQIVHDALFGKELGEVTDQEVADDIYAMFPNLKKVAEIAEKDPAFNEKLAETVKRMIRYTTETGEILDFIGDGNILLVKGENGWELKMPDPSVTEEITMDGLMVAAEKIKKHEPLSWMDAAHVRQGLATIRTLNVLAMIAGIPDDIEPGGDIAKLSVHAWEEALDQYRQQAA